MSLSGSFQVWLINCYPSVVFKKTGSKLKHLSLKERELLQVLWPNVFLKGNENGVITAKKTQNNNGSGKLIESRQVWPYRSNSHTYCNTLIRPHKQTCTQISDLTKAPHFSSCSRAHGQRVALTYLGLLDAGHVLFGQARAVKGLLWVFSVALEHLGLQLSAQRRSLPRSAREQRAERRVGVIITQHCQLGPSLVTVHAEVSLLQSQCWTFLTVYWLVYSSSLEG